MWRLRASAGDHWESGVVPTATVALTGPDGVERQGVAMGTGPVDAAYKAIDALTSVKVHLETYSMESVNAGIEAMATTKVVVNPVDSATSLHSSGYTTSRKFSGSGSDTDVVVSSAGRTSRRSTSSSAGTCGGRRRSRSRRRRRESRKGWGSTFVFDGVARRSSLGAAASSAAATARGAASRVDGVAYRRLGQEPFELRSTARRMAANRYLASVRH